MRYLLSAVLCFAACLLAQADTLLERSLRRLAETPPAAADSFDFVVLGDSRATEPYSMPPVFHQMIREWNILKPAFVVDVGDLILGGAAEGLGPQWDVFEETVAACGAPFIPIPGNHDVTDPATEAVYTSRIGAMRFSFEYGNALFIALNTEEHGQVHTLSEEQVNWLRETLEKSKAAHVFVFLHKPLFEADWDKSWAHIHAILKQHPVRLVAGCDWHLYRDCGTHDGIRYVVTGGGGAEIRTPEEEGGFNHYLWVRVRGGETSFAVMRPGNVLPPDTVSKARIDEMRLLRSSIAAVPIRVPLADSFNGVASVRMGNPYDAPLTGEITWQIPGNWRLTPGEMPYTVPAMGETTLEFDLKSIGPARFPVPEFETTVSIAKNGGPITVRNPFALIPVFDVPRARSEVSQDGDLAEWRKAPRIPLTYAFDFDPADTRDLRAHFQMQWDTEYLYLAVTAEDDEFHQPHAGDIVWSADNVQLFLNDWEWGLSLTPKGNEVFLYRGPDRERETVNTAVRLGIAQSGRTTTYEAAFPLSEISPLALAPGNTFRFSIVMNDLDPSVPSRTRHWLELTPGVGNAQPGAPLAEGQLLEK